jgi:hypothetical protein
MSDARAWFRLPFVYRARADRRESPALAAVHWDGANPHQSTVGNISASGAYLLTTKRWNSDEILSLTFQRAGALENSPQRRFTIQARSVRRDKHGIGVSFLLPRGTDVRLWQSRIRTHVPQTEPEDVVREFRLAAAIGFIHRISPSAVELAKALYREGLSNYRLESAIEIALHTEELLSIESELPRRHVHPDVLLRVLEDGSWAETEWIQHYWAGILATACIASPSEACCLKFANLLSQLTTIQARIFAGSCRQASKTVNRNTQISIAPLICNAKQLVQLADTHDRVHIERDILHLADLGLIERGMKWRFFSQLDQALITPTSLALELYARCHGHRGEVAEFYETSTHAGAAVAAD